MKQRKKPIIVELLLLCCNCGTTWQKSHNNSKNTVRNIDKEIHNTVYSNRKEVNRMNDQLEQKMQDLRAKKATSTALSNEEQAVLDALLALDEDQEDVDAARAAVAAAQAAVNTSAQQALDNANADLETKQRVLDGDMSTYQQAQSALDAATTGGTTPTTGGTTTTDGTTPPSDGTPTA